MVVVRRVNERGDTAFGVDFEDFQSAYEHIRTARQADVFIVTEKGEKHVEQTIVKNCGNGDMVIQLLKRWSW